MGSAPPPSSASLPPITANRCNSGPQQLPVAGGLDAEPHPAVGNTSEGSHTNRDVLGSESSDGERFGKRGNGGEEGGVSGAQLKRSASLPEGSQLPLPAPADGKLDKGDVMR